MNTRTHGAFLVSVCLAVFGCRAASPPETAAHIPLAETSHVPSDALPVGKSTITLDLLVNGGAAGSSTSTPIECFTYRPAHWDGSRMILVHHGVLRNAAEYRDDSIMLGDRFGALIVAPCFDKQRFPDRSYQRGGILEEDGTPADPKTWTYAYIPKIAAAVRARADRPKLRFWILGHSAGGQFAMRMAAFQDTGAERIVAANPGTDLFPTRDMPFGWGFGHLPESLSNDERLKHYLAAPLTLYLGTSDDHEDEDLDTSAESMKQGGGRLQRGRAAFALGKQLAEERGWPFAWKLVEAEGVPHDHAQMFAHPMCKTALFGALPNSKTNDP